MKKITLILDDVTNWLEATWTEEITTEVQVEKECETVTKVIHCESFGDIPEYQELFKTRCKEFGFELEKEHLSVLKKQAKNRVLPTEEELAEIVLESRKQEYQTKLLHINTEYDLAIANLSRGVPDTERSTWTKQEQEAKEYLSGIVDVPMLSSLARARNIPIEYLASKILEKASVYAKIVGELTGIRQREEDALKLEYKDIL